MNSILALFLPLINALLNFALSTGKDLAPEVKQAIQDYLALAFEIAISVVTLQLTPNEGKESVLIAIDALRSKGDVLLAKLAVAAMELPDEILGGLNSTIGSLPGMLLKLIP